MKADLIAAESLEDQFFKQFIAGQHGSRSSLRIHSHGHLPMHFTHFVMQRGRRKRRPAPAELNIEQEYQIWVSAGYEID